MPLTLTELLTQARALIADEKHWTRDASARDAAGVPVPSWDASALCWCASGAIMRFWQEDDNAICREALDLLEDAATHLYACDSLPDCNDQYGHAAIMECYDFALHAAAELSWLMS